MPQPERNAPWSLGGAPSVRAAPRGMVRAWRPGWHRQASRPVSGARAGAVLSRTIGDTRKWTGWWISTCPWTTSTRGARPEAGGVAGLQPCLRGRDGAVARRTSPGPGRRYDRPPRRVRIPSSPRRPPGNALPGVPLSDALGTGSPPHDAEGDRGPAGMLATAFVAVAAQRPERNRAPGTVFLAGAASIIAGVLLSTRLTAVAVAQVPSVRLGSGASGEGASSAL